MFFGESGSIAGGTIRTPSVIPSGTYCCMCQTLASYGSISGRRRSMVEGFGVERSMWQRQTQWRDFSEAFNNRPAGCGSWTMTTSQPSSRSRAFIAL